MKKSAVLIVFLTVVGSFFASGVAYANEPPQWRKIPTQAGFVGEEIQFSVRAFDYDGDQLTYTASNLPTGSSFNPRTKFFTWIPQNSGNFNITFTAFDGHILVSTSALVVVRDIGQGSPPDRFRDTDGSPLGPPNFVNFNPPLVATEGQLYTYTVQAAGSIGAPVSYRLPSAPQGMGIDSVRGIISWIPNFNQGRAEPYTVTAGISNAQYENTRSFQVFVQDVSQTAPPPIVKPPSGRVRPPPAAEELKISSIKFEKENGDIVITWRTNLPARGRVIYDTKSQKDKTKDFTYKNATPDSTELLLEHTVRLKADDLEPGATYYFRAVAKRNSQVATSGELTFTAEAGGLALLSSLGEFLSNPWFWIIVIIIILFLLYRRFVKK